MFYKKKKMFCEEKANSMSILTIFLGSCLGGTELNKVKKPD